MGGYRIRPYAIEIDVLSVPETPVKAALYIFSNSAFRVFNFLSAAAFSLV